MICLNNHIFLVYLILVSDPQKILYHPQLDAILLQKIDLKTRMFTQKSDLYSFGLVLWSIHKEIDWSDFLNASTDPDEQMRFPLKALGQIHGEVSNFLKVVVACLDKQPAKRPSCLQIIRSLQPPKEKEKDAKIL